MLEKAHFLPFICLGVHCLRTDSSDSSFRSSGTLLILPRGAKTKVGGQPRVFVSLHSLVKKRKKGRLKKKKEGKKEKSAFYITLQQFSQERKRKKEKLTLYTTLWNKVRFMIGECSFSKLVCICKLKKKKKNVACSHLQLT